jgi:hypothetical protein
MARRSARTGRRAPARQKLKQSAEKKEKRYEHAHIPAAAAKA